MKRLISMDQLSWRLGIGVSVVVIFGLALGFHLTYLTYRAEMLEAARNHAASEAQLVRLALSHQMLESGDRSLIYGMVQSFGAEHSSERIMVLDRLGKVRFSSDERYRKHVFSLKDPACQVCHRFPAAQRNRSTILDIEGGSVLRSVQPIPNREACHTCHDAKNRINGVLIVDVPVGATIANMEHSVRRMALGTAVVGLVLIGGISLAFRRFLLRRLYRFERAALAIASGDMSQRVPVEGNDALTRLEVSFNEMVDSVSSLLSSVEAQGEHLRRVMDSVDDGMVVLDRDMAIVATNDAFQRRFPTEDVELVGRHCFEAVRGAGMCGDGSECPGHACFGSGKVHTAIRTRIDLSGQPRHEEVRISPLFAADGSVERVVEVWRDITDRRSAEARLAEYQRLASVGMLASGISHEVNTPLSSIGTCLEAIDRICAEGANTAEDRAALRNYAQIAAEQVRRCGAITQQFLKLARGRSPDSEIIELVAATTLVARLVGPTAKVAGVTIDVQDDAVVPQVLASSASVHQVLLNLIMNAVEASKAGGRVRVRFGVTNAAEGDSIEVQVQDEGAGIAAEDLPRVFEPFFSRRARGTGLGLFVSLNLARGWGGDVRVVASQAGQGTTFAVQFPRRRPAASSEGTFIAS